MGRLRFHLASLAVPVLAGLAWMSLAEAPALWLAVNAGALALAIAAALWLPLPRHNGGQLALALVSTALLTMTVLAGIEADGVRRWLQLGPLRLHIGYLVLPLLVTLADRLPAKPASALLLGAVLACALQPDRATSFGLAAATAMITLNRPVLPFVGALVAAFVGAAVALGQVDPLQPVRFVETVQIDTWHAQPLIGIALMLATFAPLLLLRDGQRTARPLAAFLIVAGLMAFVGAYPSILIGYGAAPILGFGLAISALRTQ